jgi:GT2 family glycosyltransferase
MSSNMHDTPLLSVIALTWNSKRFVRDFVTTLVTDARDSDISVELLVVDNGSTDGTLEAFDELGQSTPELKVFRQPINRGTTISRNLALREARGKYVLVVDSDTLIPPGTLSTLLESHRRLSSNVNLGILAPRLTYPNGEFQESARRFPTAFTKLARLSRWEKLRRWDESIPAVLALRETRVDYAISAAWFFENKLLSAIGYLDELIFYAPEDVEFCARAWAAGFEVWYCPDATIIHDCQRITSKRPLSSLGLEHTKGLAYHWRKHGGFLFRKSFAK